MQALPFTPSKNSILYANLTDNNSKIVFLKGLLKNYKLSATHILKYKSCSKSFLQECFLKVKYPPNIAMLKGIIAHALLDWVFKFHKAKNCFPNEDELVVQFFIFKEKEEEKYSIWLQNEEVEDLKKLMLSYYLSQRAKWNTIVVTEFYVLKHIWNSIPLTGFIDKIEFNGRNVNIVDYKTGNIERALEKMQKGNDYWFQLGFYAVVLESYKPQWSVTTVEMCMISGDEKDFINAQIVISDQDKARIKQEIIEVYNNILELKFDGCGKEDCFWCNEK